MAGASGSSVKYDIVGETRKSLDILLDLAKGQLPSECRQLAVDVAFNTRGPSSPYFPCPFKETEAISALKAVEAGMASTIANLRFGNKPRKATVDLERATAFMFSAYLATVAGMNKGDPNLKSVLKDTDYLAAQSIQYRRLAANLYKTANPDEYYHIHGSLEATATLNMIGLEGHRPDMTGYRECIDLIENQVMKYTADQLEKMNAEKRQAGVTCLKLEDWDKSEHGRILAQEPPFRVEATETSTPPALFPEVSQVTPQPQILAGVKVIELCRIIAGPSMGRGLAEYGAEVIKIVAPRGSDVPFFQVDGNLGKHTADMDLRQPEDRKIFEALLDEADVVLDGYRPGSIERLGYGPKQLVERGQKRGKGFVYVAEDCFGHVGPWAQRAGWQQIADCATGIAWLQGQFMGLKEPVIPPFPMSDYGCGCQGTIAALVGLYQRATKGGSYHGTTSLCQYDLYLRQLGLHSEPMQEELRREHDDEFFQLRHADSVDEVGKRALKTMKRNHPELFADEHFQKGFSSGYNAEVKFVKPVVNLEGTWCGFVRSSRPNGFDKPSWGNWEVDKAMFQ